MFAGSKCFSLNEVGNDPANLEAYTNSYIQELVDEATSLECTKNLKVDVKEIGTTIMVLLTAEQA